MKRKAEVRVRTPKWKFATAQIVNHIEAPRQHAVNGIPGQGVLHETNLPECNKGKKEIEK